MPELYRQAASLAPVLVVLEDIDLIVGDRTGGAPSHELVEFLLAVDGAVTPHTGVVTIATTNDAKAIDPAASTERPGSTASSRSPRRALGHARRSSPNTSGRLATDVDLSNAWRR